ncbi:PRC-barrel domain protein [Halanaerobium saccharolyticum]|uniref:PRC-barrel domain protein n=1 Tax=Halanaerobium saccharolyticum TaxID=43595 RepID=A0A4R6M1Q9_9FIRM|nr:PRC-barrel domain-containing protein [Halanaerobium saccharolyticum]TDO95161.1 PRC-barrel domain protein [Halanaerobium saccharolyticum]
MLRKMKDLKGYTLHGKEEDLGEVEDFYFDQERFVMRYVVIDTGNWLKHEQTLISPEAFEEINYKTEEIFVNLNSEELKEGPSIKKNKPVSREIEEKLVNHFEWPIYWTSPYPSSGPAVQPGSMIRDKIFNYAESTAEQKQTGKEDLESNLRSFNEVTGYHIQAEDEEFGHVEDLFVDEENWVIRYLLVDTRNILPGKDVLIAPEWLENISWNDEKIFVNKTKEEIKSAPEYQEEKSDYLVDRDYEEKLYDHYDELKYWQQ